MSQRALERLETLDLRPVPPAETADAREQQVRGILEHFNAGVTSICVLFRTLDVQPPLCCVFVPLCRQHLVLKLDVLFQTICGDNVLKVSEYLRARRVDCRPLGMWEESVLILM